MENTNIEIVFIPGRCTSFLQPLDMDLNKLKKKNSNAYSQWLDSMKDNIRKDLEENTAKVLSESGVLKAPEYDLYRQWVRESVSKLPKQLIINSFVHCGITFGLSSIVHLNRSEL